MLLQETTKILIAYCFTGPCNVSNIIFSNNTFRPCSIKKILHWHQNRRSRDIKFLCKNLKILLEYAHTKPCVNQVEFHAKDTGTLHFARNREYTFNPILFLCGKQAAQTRRLWGKICGNLELESSGCDRGLHRPFCWSDDLCENLEFPGMNFSSKNYRSLRILWKVVWEVLRSVLMFCMIGVWFLSLWILKGIIDYGPPSQYYRSAVTTTFTLEGFPLDLDSFSGSRCPWQGFRREI